MSSITIQVKIKMKKLILINLLLAVVTAVNAQNSGDSLIYCKETVRKIDEYILPFESENHFSGVVLVAKNGEVIFEKAYGYANREWMIPNTINTKFRIGSLTKQFTSFLIVQLAEQGKIDLHGKISDYLEFYRKDNGNKITVHHLLTHTSGLPIFSGKPLPESFSGDYPVILHLNENCFAFSLRCSIFYQEHNN